MSCTSVVEVGEDMRELAKEEADLWQKKWGEKEILGKKSLRCFDF